MSRQETLEITDFFISKTESDEGFLRSNGNIDSANYLTEHQDISGKVNTSDSRLTDARTPLFNHIGATSSNTKDLNNYTTGGFYYCKYDKDEAPYIANQPWTTGQKAFHLLVQTWGATDASYAKQTLTYYTNGQTYIRTKRASSGWTDWIEITKDTNTTYSVATQSANGLLSSTDKKKLDGITESADSVSFTQTKTSGIEIGKININGTETKLYQQDNNITYSNATTSANGLMSSTDKTNLTTLLNRYDGVYITQGNTTSKPFYRLFHIQAKAEESSSSKLIFELNDVTSNRYAKVQVYLRQNRNGQTHTVDTKILEASSSFDASILYFGFSDIYPNTFVDVFIELQAMWCLRVKVYDDHLRDGTYTQYTPVASTTEVYSSVEDAGAELYNSTYKNITQGQNVIKGDKLIKNGGTSNEFLKADGSIDNNTYLTTNSASSTYLSKTDASNTYQLKGNYLTEHQNISGKENTSNKTNSMSITASEKSTKYPTVEAVENYAQPKGNYLTEHQNISGKENTSNKTNTMSITASEKSTKYPTVEAVENYIESVIGNVNEDLMS